MEKVDFNTIDNQAEAIELAIKTCLDCPGEEESESAYEYLSQIMLNDPDTLDDYLNSSDCNLDEVVNIDIVKEHILENSGSFSLQELAENGHQWAFDALADDGWMCGLDWEYYADFIVECYTNGVDTGNNFEVVVEALDHDEYTVNLFAENGLFNYLDRQLPTYSWIEECLRGNDDVAIIAERYLKSVVRHKEDFNWLKNQADSKIPQAQYLMGVLYLPNDLHIVKENSTLALRYLIAARDGGCVLADAKIKKLENEQKEGTERKTKAARRGTGYELNCRNSKG